jgi:hypothetical protein
MEHKKALYSLFFKKLQHFFLVFIWYVICIAYICGVICRKENLLCNIYILINQFSL